MNSSLKFPWLSGLVLAVLGAVSLMVIVGWGAISMVVSVPMTPLP
jgi:hypothetical protein